MRKKGNTFMRENLKERLKKDDNKRKKEKRDNLDDDEKDQLRKYKKKGKKFMRDYFNIKRQNG